MKEEVAVMAEFSADQLAEIEAFIERTSSPEHRMTQVEAICCLARLALAVVVRAAKTEAEIAAWEKENPEVETLLDVALDEEQLAQIDALIEEHSTPTHVLTRDAMLQILLEKGRRAVKPGESLLLFLDSMTDTDETMTKH